MNIPNGTTIIFDGGEFNGVLPSSCEIKGSAEINATGNEADVVLGDAYELPVGSSLSLTGGTLTATDATISGSLSCDGTEIDAEELTTDGTTTITRGGDLSIQTLNGVGTANVSCATASGNNWQVATLTTTGDATIQTLTSAGAVEIGGEAEGEDWLATSATFQDNAEISELTCGDVLLGGNAEGVEWTVGNLSASSDSIRLNVTTLVLNGECSVGVDGVSTLTINETGSLVIAQNATVSTLTTEDGAELTFDDGAFLSVATSATFEPTTLNGAGYLALPYLTPTENLSQAEGADVRVLTYGAGITSFNAFAKTKSTVAFRWTSENAEVPFLIEKQTDDGWVVISDYPTTGLTDAQTAPATYRAFDGVTFIVNEADPTTLNAQWRWRVDVLPTNGGSGDGENEAWATRSIVVIAPQYD